MLTAEAFARLPLHDALLDRIIIDWRAHTCVIEVRAFLARGEWAQTAELHFRGVSDVRVPHRAPWGESVSINSVGAESDDYVLEVQSGDEIRIRADAVEFNRAPSGSTA
ncbi:MAG TPA: hypothetical protein VFL93_11815 [Longimicrobiaceae bacterium]|nr:hypothetical protein [Longimicrobiaceae bacterium]